MNALTIFGVVAVAAMLVFYALEYRSPAFILCFAGACVASSVYGFLQGAWPFGAVEAIWTGVAFRRWQHGRLGTTENSEQGAPIVCDMHALAPTERRRYDQLRTKILAAPTDVRQTSRGVAMRISRAVTLLEVAEWISFERRCRPFLDIVVTLDRGTSTSIELYGGSGVREFLRQEFPFGARRSV